MGEMIKKPDANPIVLALLNLFLFGSIGYFVMGQSQKGIAALVYTLVGCCLAPIPALVFAYDAYLLGQKLALGESVGETENGLDFLDNLPGFN